jgi:hypothetical protein
MEFYGSIGDVRLNRPKGPAFSCKAQFTCWGTFGYKLGLVLAVICLAVTGTFIAFLPEKLAERLVTFIFVGIVPALLSYLIGCMTYLVMKGASASIIQLFRFVCWHSSYSAKLFSFVGVLWYGPSV